MLHTFVLAFSHSLWGEGALEQFPVSLELSDCSAFQSMAVVAFLILHASHAQLHDYLGGVVVSLLYMKRRSFGMLSPLYRWFFLVIHTF